MTDYFDDAAKIARGHAAYYALGRAKADMLATLHPKPSAPDLRALVKELGAVKAAQKARIAELEAVLYRIAYRPFGRSATHAEVLNDITELARRVLAMQATP